MTICFHCNQPSQNEFSSQLDGAQRFFCCAGCRAVAEMIFAQGLSSYYQHRSSAANKVDLLPTEIAMDAFEPYVQFNDSVNKNSVTLFIEDLNCPACAWLIERSLRQDDNICTVSSNLSARRTLIEWRAGSIDVKSLIERLQHIGYRALPYSEDKIETALERENLTLLKRLAVAAFGMMQAMMYTFGLYFGLISDLSNHDAIWLRWAGMLCTLPVVLYSAIPFYRNAWRALKWRSANMDLPVSIGILAAFTVSTVNTLNESGQVYFDSIAMFAFLLLASRYIETRIRDAANKAAVLQQRLLPTHVNCWRNQKWQSLALNEIRIDDTIRVSAGEIIALDGEVISGDGSVDERIISGESIPVFKQVGTTVLAGSLLQGGSLDICVKVEGSQSYLARLSQLQDQAMAERPSWQLLADRVAHYFVVSVLLIAVGTYLFWHFHNPEKAFDILLAVLVVTCPCALSLALPTAWAAATKRLLQNGFLIRRAQTLAALSRIDTVVLDKTGTLSNGRFELAQVNCLSTLSQEYCLQLAAALESHSKHPIAKAFNQHQRPNIIATEVTEQSGVGLRGFINGVHYFIGRREGLAPSIQLNNDDAQFYLANDHEVLASFILHDQLRVDAHQFIRRLKQQNLNVVIASGDYDTNVAQCAQQLGIDTYRSRLMPEQKLQWVRELQAQGHAVLMIGDGINDAPVLAGADASIAVGDGVDFARRASDAVLTHPSLFTIIDALQLAQKTRHVVVQNLYWAVFYNLLALPSAMSGALSPWEAALGMSVSSLLVTLNSMRLQSKPKPLTTAPYTTSTLVETP